MKITGFENIKSAICRCRPLAWVFLIYFILALVTTYPLIFRLSSAIYGYPGDPLGVIWHFWWFKYAGLHHLPQTYCNLVAAPFGVDYSQNYLSLSLWEMSARFLVKFLNEVTVYNILAILSFPLSGISMYLLSYYLTRSRLASFFAGFIFAFSAPHLMKAKQHLSLAHMEWIPFFFLFLFRAHLGRIFMPDNSVQLEPEKPDLIRKKVLFDVAICGLVFGLIMLSDMSYAYFICLITVFFIICYWGYRICRRLSAPRAYTVFKGWPAVRHIITAYLLFLFVLMLVVLPYVWSNWQKPSAADTLSTRSFGYVLKYSARFGDYFRPNLWHPLWGGRTAKETMDLGGTNNDLAERTIYLGFIPLFLAGCGLLTACFRKQTGLKVLVLFAGLAVVLAVLFSLVPYFFIGSREIILPSFFLYQWVPGFRAYARFGIMAGFWVSLLSGIGMSYILNKPGYNSRKSAVLVTGIACLLAGIEVADIPPSRVMDFGRVPAVYQWLSEQPGDFIAAEYFPGAKEYRLNEPYYTYLFYQRLHQKRLVNDSADSVTRRIGPALLRLKDPSLPAALHKLGVKYIIIHQGSLNETDLVGEKGFRFVGEFGRERVYEIDTRGLTDYKVEINIPAMIKKGPDPVNWRFRSYRAEPYFYLAYDLSEHGNFKRAVDRYRQAIKLNPEYSEAYCNLGYCLARMGQYEEARQAILQAIKLEPENKDYRYNLKRIEGQKEGI